MFSKRSSIMRSRAKAKNPLKGHVLKVSSMPSEFTSRPWFRLTVRVQNPGASITVASIALALNDQLNIVDPQPIDIRINNIRLWGSLGPGGTTNLQPLFVIFHDFIQNSGTATTLRTLEEVTRYPNEVQRASVGYCYSEAHKEVTLSSSTTITVVTASGLGADSVAYVDLLWRFSSNVPAFYEEAFVDVPRELTSTPSTSRSAFSAISRGRF